MTRRQEINRLDYTRAFLGDSKITWPQAQKKLDSSQARIINQLATMKADKKESWAAFHKNDYKSANKAWSKLSKNNPNDAADIKNAKLLAQIKMVYGKDALSLAQKHKINEFLAQLVAEGESFGQYWGY